MNEKSAAKFTVWTIVAICLLAMLGTRPAAAGRTCLVLADGYASEYSWGVYSLDSYPLHHPGHTFLVRGVMDYPDRFRRWLDGYEVKRVDLENHTNPLKLNGVDLVVIDEVRQYVLAPHETAIADYVRRGGSVLIYAGYWGLGGSPKDKFNVNKKVNDPDGPLSRILPVEILRVPDWEMKQESWGNPSSKDGNLLDGMDSSKWRLYGLHTCRAKGKVLAEVDDRPLVVFGDSGKGRVVVYTGDDLAWIRAGGRQGAVNPYSRSLWQRLASLATGDDNIERIRAVSDPSPSWEKTAAFAHPDQPINFLWGGFCCFLGMPELETFWARDLVTHGCNLYFTGSDLNTPEVLGKAGIDGWFTVWEFMPREECVNNPAVLRKMGREIAKKAAGLKACPWIRYGHMGDETAFKYCSCEYCRAEFREVYGYELPELKSDMSPQYLDRWIDYCLFKNKSVGRMYTRASRAAHESNSNVKYMLASLPQCAGMAYGDDQFQTQAGFDLLWDHTYPGTQSIRVGLNSAILEETAVLQGRPYVPVYNLLQGFDCVSRTPAMPPAGYIRTMAWQAIAHGTDSVGWFGYNMFWWNMPGTEAWEEAGRMGREVLEPLTPTLYQMLNAPEPIGLLYSYSQEAVDGLKAQTLDEQGNPWGPAIRFWSLHALHEAHEVMKYAHLPFNVISEHRLFQSGHLPWKAIVIPYVEHLHATSRRALEEYIANGGIVYLGKNSTLDLEGARRLPMPFDNFIRTWLPEGKPEEWNQRRSRVYTIEASLEKAEAIRKIFSSLVKEATAETDDPEVVCHVRQAGDAKYIFFVNDHQTNPVSPELREKRQQYDHYALMPMEFPDATTKAKIRGTGYLYPLLSSSNIPRELTEDEEVSFDLKLDGGDGRVFLLLPERIAKVEFLSRPKRRQEGVEIEVRVVGKTGAIKAALPLRIDISCDTAGQTVYTATRDGVASWTAPFLKTFPDLPLTVTVTDLASGKRVQSQTP